MRILQILVWNLNYLYLSTFLAVLLNIISSRGKSGGDHIFCESRIKTETMTVSIFAYPGYWGPYNSGNSATSQIHPAAIHHFIWLQILDQSSDLQIVFLIEDLLKQVKLINNFKFFALTTYWWQRFKDDWGRGWLSLIFNNDNVCTAAPDFAGSAKN